MIQQIGHNKRRRLDCSEIGESNLPGSYSGIGFHVTQGLIQNFGQS